MEVPITAALRFASSISAGDKSTPHTRAPRRAAVIATTPVPHATSSTWTLSRTPAYSTSRAAGAVVNTAQGENEAHPSRCTALNCANGSSCTIFIPRGYSFGGSPQRLLVSGGGHYILD